MSSPSTTGPSTVPPPTKAKVMIVGAGIGGLVLAALLERAGIEYNVYERAKKVIPLGSAISMGPSVMYFFEQLGIADEVKANSTPVLEGIQYDDDLKMIAHHKYSYLLERYGHYSHIITRSVLYNIIENLVPKEKIHFGTKVLSFMQNKEGVMIRTWDNQTHHGDILVGADGAYSAVRQSLYQQLEKTGLLPASDKERLPFTSVCLVGTTEPLDMEKFKFLNQKDCYFRSVASSKPYTWVMFTTTGNRVCWTVIEHLNKASAKDNDSFRNSEWGPEAAEAMCNEVRDFPFPEGVTVGDYIDRTPKELISKVMLEEKLFETWYGGRTVLLGDSCHKMHPAAGLGAVSAIHDAIVLASRLYGLRSTEVGDLEKVFKEYKAERYPLAVKSYESSRNMAKLVVDKTWINALIRIFAKHMPLFVWLKILDSLTAYRPQATFLPLIPDRGTVKPAKQTSLELAKKFPQTAQKVAPAAGPAVAPTTPANPVAAAEPAPVAVAEPAAPAPIAI